MKVSVIIAHENRESQLSLCLDALEKQVISKNDYEVIVVGKTNQEILLDKTCNIRFIENLRKNGEMFNLAKLRNIGAENANGEILVFIDCDIIVMPDFIEKIVELHANRNILSFAPRRRLKKNTIINRSEDVKQAEFELDEREIAIIYFDMKFENVNSKWLWVYGHTVCVRKNTFMKLGTFCEDMVGWGLEDTEFAYRYNKAGIELYYDRKCICYHLWHDENLGKKTLNEYNKNMQFFINKYADPTLNGLKLCADCLTPKKAMKLSIYGVPSHVLPLLIYESYVIGYKNRVESVKNEK